MSVLSKYKLGANNTSKVLVPTEYGGIAFIHEYKKLPREKCVGERQPKPCLAWPDAHKGSSRDPAAMEETFEM